MMAGMAKGERTRRRIVERAAPVFNTRGYAGSSMNDLVRASGLKKGGLYNHFSGKEELAIAAFDHAAALMRGRFRAEMEGCNGSLELLFAVVDAFGALVEDPPVAGGCPVLNTAVESDDTHPVLKERARAAMEDWLRLIGRLVKDGIENGELRSGADPRHTASVVVAALEGALMLSKLHDDPAHMTRTVDHVKRYLESLTSTNGGVDG